MGSGQFKVTPGDISGAAPRFAAAADDVRAAVGALRAALAGDAAAIGHDAPGSKFGWDYQPHKEQLLTAIGTLSEGLESIGAALQAMAHNYGGAEATNTRMLGGGS